MINTFVGEIRGYFGKAFVPAVWIPLLIFSATILMVCFAGQGSLVVNWQKFWTFNIEIKILLITTFLIIVTLIALVVHYLQVPISRLFEGYWQSIPVLRSVMSRKKNYYRKQFLRYFNILDTLEETIPSLEQELQKDKQPSPQKLSDLETQKAKFNELSEKLTREFPPPRFQQQIMPTRLGNIYKAAELYSLDRYGIDSVVFWPRLLEVLPQTFLERLQETKIAVDTLLLFSLLCIVFSVTAVPYALFYKVGFTLLVICALGIPLGWLLYWAALLPAGVYAELIRVAYDLYRRDLIHKFGLQLPSSLMEERKLWEELSSFILLGISLPANWQFDSSLT
jgi:hypothetical protein